MHSFRSHKHPNFHVHHNGDYSGNATIVEGNGVVGAQTSIEVPCEVLLEFVAQAIVGERISKLEQMSTNQILGIEEG